MKNKKSQINANNYTIKHATMQKKKRKKEFKLNYKQPYLEEMHYIFYDNEFLTKKKIIIINKNKK